MKYNKKSTNLWLQITNSREQFVYFSEGFVQGSVEMCLIMLQT